MRHFGLDLSVKETVRPARWVDLDSDHIPWSHSTRNQSKFLVTSYVDHLRPRVSYV